jgi:hypothetical protein
MTRTVALLSLVTLFGLVCSPNGVLASPNAGLLGRELMEKRNWREWSTFRLE